MKMRLLIFAAYLLPLGLLSAPAAVQTKLTDIPAVELKNKFLRAVVVPETMGAVAQLRWLPGVINELLPEQKAVTVWGNRSLIWNGTVLFYQPLNNYTFQADKKQTVLQMTGRYIGGLPISMTRTLTLEENTGLIKITVTIENFGKAAQEIRLWEHLVPNPEGSTPDVSFITGPGVRRLGRYQDTEKHAQGLLTDTFKDGNANRYLVPGDNWIAATGGQTPLTVLLRTDAKNLAEDGFFYTHKSAVAQLHTVEVLLKRVQVKPKEKFTVQLELGVLSGLKTLRRLTKDHGFDFQRSGRELSWQAAVLKTVPARKFLISAGKWQKEFTVPALAPGKNASGKISGVPEVKDDLFTIRELSK